MSLLPLEQQQAVFEAMRRHPALAERDILHIPDLVEVSRLDPEAFATMVDDLSAQREAVYDQLEHLPSQKYTFVPEYVLAYGDDGARRSFDIPGGYNRGRNIRDLEQLDGYSIALASRYSEENPELVVGPGSLPGYDATARLYDARAVQTPHGWDNEVSTRMVLDINTDAVDANATFYDLLEMSDFTLRGVQEDHRRFVAQADTLGGGINLSGRDIPGLLPPAALARKIAVETLGHANFLLPIAVGFLDSQDELRPLVASEPNAPATEIVNIADVHGDLEYYQATRDQRLQIYGNAVVAGPPYVLRDNMSPPAPEGSVVIVNNESGLEGVQTVQLAGAAAILTRGYTGQGDRMRTQFGTNYDHLNIIGRALFAANPHDFVYFKAPHINPDTDELAAWDALQSCDTVTVATDGTDIKIKGNRTEITEPLE